MNRNTFDSWRRRRSTLGQQRLADTIRTLLYRADETLFDRLDFSSDEQFLHPTLFAYFTGQSPLVSLPQVLYGLVPAEHRPKCLRVQTDGLGQACLSRVGTIETALPTAVLDFGRPEIGARYSCLSGGRSVPFRLRSPLLIPGTRIEVTTDIHPLFQRFFEGEDGGSARPGEALSDRLFHLLMALDLMRLHSPESWRQIAAFTRLIVLYRSAGPNSFAALSAHGAIFCNVRDGEDEVALLEDVAHQAAHVIFNAFGQGSKSILTVDPETTVDSISVGPRDARPIHEAFHALFTYTLICQVLLDVYEAGVLPERQSHELLGRFGFTLLKFAADLARLNLPAAYTAVGQRCYCEFSAEFERIKTRYSALVAGFSYDNQPYTFDYSRFVDRNGGPWPVMLGVAA